MRLDRDSLAAIDQIERQPVQRRAEAGVVDDMPPGVAIFFEGR